MRILLVTLVLLSVPTARASELPGEVSSAAEAIAKFHPATTVRMINVWATWCVPCVAEMKDLDGLYEEFGPKGLEIIGITMDDLLPGDRDAAKKKVVRFLDARSISFTNVYYTGKAEALMDELGFEGAIPVTILYDRQGRVLKRVQGAIDRAEMEQTLQTLLAGHE